MVRTLKAVAKPILRSKEFRQVIASMDELMDRFRDNENVRAYLSLALDVAQDIYETKDSSSLRRFVKEVFFDYYSHDPVSERVNLNKKIILLLIFF